MRAAYFVVLLVVAFSIGYSHPTTFQCSRYCKEDWNKFGYEVGNSYFYLYSGTVKTGVNASVNHGINAQSTNMHFSAKVQISVLSVCDYVIQLSDAKFEETYINKNTVITHNPDKNRKFAELLEKHSLYFSYSNGRIETTCPNEDNQKVIHLKKAILSAFQNSMPNLEKDAIVYESDISGNCETHYQIEDRIPNLTVRKSKRLEACSHRNSRHTSWLTVPYTKNSNKNFASLLRSNQSCTQRFNKELILVSSECEERHQFQPFSNNDNGAVTYLTQSLKFKEKSNKILDAKIPKNFHYESLLPNYKSEVEKTKKTETVLKLLQNLESKTIEGVEPGVPKLFSLLVHELQSLDHSTLIDIFRTIKKSSRQKKFVLDAMSLITTTDGVETMKALYNEGELTHSQMNSWLSSIIFHKDVSLSLIESMTPLLTINKFIKQRSTLTISSLIHKYCNHDSRCFDKQQIQNVIRIITESITTNCVPSNTEQQNEMLLSLKAVGNMGVTTSLESLKKCFSNRDSPTELRLAAIAAHRRMSCVTNENLEYFENYFANIHENTEIRIASYLAAMQCASYATFARIKDVLRTDETNQVGSFVWTHLTNLQESSSPWKRNLKNLIENEFLRNKFSTDMRKYSRNYEVSTFFDSLNTGATVESNVVFTSESYLPKSAMFNFTLDMFGEAVNILEVGARIEGFEQVFENLFGPEGYFPEESIRNVLENVRTGQNKSQDKIQEIRDSFSSQTTPKEPNGMLYAKIFGNEISYTHFKSLGLSGQVNAGIIMEALLKLFRQQDIEYTNSFVFIDSSYKIPTVLGFPLELAVNGTATIGLTVKGKMDVKDLWAYKVAVEGKIYPSAAVDVIGTMMIDTLVDTIGLRSENTLNSNTYLDGHAFINKGKLVDLKLNVPKKQMNIINVESQIFLVQSDRVYSMDDLSDNIEDVEACTKKMFNTITGLEFCYNFRYVNASLSPSAPYFPLTGKFQYTMDIKKTDQFDSYQLNLKTHTEVRNFRPIYSMALYFDTPNSLINRKIETSYLLDCEKLSLTAALASPFVNLEINSKIGEDYDNLGFLLQTKLNDNEILLANMSLKSTKVDNTWKYVPVAVINYKNTQIVAVSGNINYLQGTKYSADLKLETNNNEPIRITGDLNLEAKDEFQLTASLKSKDLNGKAQAVVVKRPESIYISAKTIYDYKNLKQQVLNVEFKAASIRKGTLAEESVYMSMNSTQNPLYNTLLSFTTQRDKLYLESKGIFTLFGITWNGHQLLKFLRTNTDNDIALKFSLGCLQRNIDYDIDLSYIKSDNVFKTHGLIQLNRTQRVESLISYNMVPDRNRTLQLLLYYPKQLWVINGVFTQQTEKKYTIFLHGFYEIEEEKRSLLTLSGEYVNSTISQFQNHTINGIIKIPDDSSWQISSSLQISPDIFMNTAQLKSTNDIFVSHVTWTVDSFTALLQRKEKQLLLINGFKGEKELSISFGLNIYQHFELSLKLLMPYEKFQFVLYWDKDRDLNQKLALLIDHYQKQGLYQVDLEYPNQKIMASFILLPMQVTMNVTWGIDSSQRIYLKAGNKIYDIGGIWFARLETPFQYLETQEFKLSYYALPQNAELKIDISWRDQQINAIMSGIKSASRLSGYMELNTTLPEISNINVAVSHSHNTTDGLFKVKNDATFILNDHQIMAQSIWKSQGTNISSSFEIVSPSNSIEPIVGSLIIDNNHITNHLSGFVNWKKKTVSIDYKFQNSQSYIRIKTPFEGLEVTELDYTIIGEADKLVLEVRINLLTHLNHALLSWNNEGHASSVKFEVTCPIIGSYKVIFKHSTIFGHLEEYLVITQGQDNDILAVKLYGDLVPILMMDVNATVKLLEHKASITLKNNPDPLHSIIEARWDETYIISTLIVVFDDKEISDLGWNVSSSLLDGNISCRYTHNNNFYMINAVLPKGYKFNNVLSLDDSYKWINNVLNVESPDRSGFLHYSHMIGLDNKNFDNKIIFRMNSNESRFTLKYNFNDSLKFIDSACIKFSTPWHHPIVLNFSIVQENSGILKPSILLEYKNKKMLEIKSSLDLQYLSSKIEADIDVPFMDPFHVDAKYNFTERLKAIDVSVTNKNSQFKINNFFMLERLEGILSLNVTLNDQTTKRDLVELFLGYNAQTLSKNINFHLFLPEHQHKIEFKAYSSIKDNINKIDAVFLSTINGWENVFVDIQLGLTEDESYIIFGMNGKTLTAKYVFYTGLENENLHSTGKIMILSYFEVIENCTIELLYKGNHKFQSLNLTSLIGQYSGLLQANYGLNRQFDKGLQRLLINGGLILKGYKISETYNDEILNFDINSKSSIETKRSGSSVTLNFISNIPKLEKLVVQANYGVLKKGYNAKATLTYNNLSYSIDHHLQHLPHKFECWVNCQTPLEFYGNANIDFVLVRSNSGTDAVLEFEKNSKAYNVSLSTKHDALVSSTTVIKLNTPDKRYKGQISSNVSLSETHIKMHGIIDGEANQAEFIIKTDSYENCEINLYVSLGSLQIMPLTLKAAYDFSSSKRNFMVHLNNEQGADIEVLLDKQKLYIGIDTEPNKNFLVLSGTHNLQTIHDLSFFYTLYMDEQKVKFDLIHKVEEEIKTSLDVSTTIKGWNRITFKSVLSYDKFEVTLHFKEHSISCMVNRKALFNNQKLLGIEFNRTPFLIIWTGNEKSHLSSITPWGNYKLLLEYAQNPKKYGLIILEDELKLLSLTIDNIHTETYFDFTAKMASPLLSKFSNLTLYFYTDYKIPNEFQFTLHNGLDSLLAMSYRFQLVEEHYLAVFDFRSVIEALQVVSISFDFEPEFTLQLEASKTQYNIENLYVFTINLPFNSNEAQLEVKYPWQNEYCSLSVLLKYDHVHFNLETPFKEWKKIVFRTGYAKSETSASGYLKLQRNNAYGDAKWSYGYNEDEVFLNIDAKNNLGKEHSKIGYILVDAKYVYQDNTVIIYKVDELGHSIDFLFNNELNYVLLKTKMILPTLIQDFDIDLLVMPFDKARVILLINEDKVLNVTMNKVIKEDALIGQIDISIYDDLHYYNINFMYDYQNMSKPILTGYFHSKTYDYLLNADIKSELDVNYQNGNIMASIEKGWEFDTSNLNKNNYELVWWMEIHETQKSARVSFKKNFHLTYVNLIHSTEDNKFNSEVTVSCGEQALNLEVNGTSNSESANAVLTLKTPLKELSELKAEVSLTQINGSVEFYNIILWPDQQQLILHVIVQQGIDSSLMQLQFSSPFNHPLEVELNYRLNGGQIQFQSKGSMGQQNIALISTIVPNSYLTATFESPFAGYTSLNLTMSFDRETQKAQVYFEKETLMFDFIGSAKLRNDYNYEINMTANQNEIDSSQNIAKVVLKLDTNRMKTSADIIWKNTETHLGMNFDPKHLLLELNSPFEPLQNIQLQGQYVRDSNISTLQANGMWNKVSLNFQGSIFTEDNNFTMTSQMHLGENYKGALHFYSSSLYDLQEINFNAYFPNRESNIVMMFLSEKLNSGTKSRVVILTPFESMTKALAEIIVDEKYIDSKVKSNLLGQELTADFSLRFDSPTASLVVAVPQIEGKWEVKTNFDVQKYGFLNIYYEYSNNFNNILFNYEISNSTLKSFYKLNGTKGHINHTMEIRLTEGNITFAVDEYNFSYQLTNNLSEIKLLVKLNLPNFDIKSEALFSRNFLENTIKGKFLYNNYYVNAQIAKRPSGGNYSISSNVGQYYIGNIYGEFENIQDGYLIMNNLSDVDGLWFNITATYINNKDVVKLITYTKHSLLQPFATNFYISKSTDKILIDIQDTFSLDIINTPPVSKLHAAIKGNTNHTLLINFERDGFDFLLDSPIIEPENVKINLQWSSEDTEKQIEFHYLQKDLSVLKGHVNFQHNKELTNKEYLLTISAMKYSSPLLECSGKILITNVTQGFAFVEILKIKNHAYFLISPNDPYMAGVTIGSPFLPYGGFTLETGTSISSSSLFIFAGTGPSDLLEDGFIHLESHKKYVLFEARYEDHNKIFVKYEAPSISWLRLIDIQAGLDVNGSNVKLFENLEIKSDYTDHILIQSKFNALENYLQAETHFLVPFIIALPRLDAEILIPFGFSDNFNPKVLIGLPNTNYSVHAIYKRQRNEFVLSGGYQCASQKFNAIFQLSNTPEQTIFTELILPLGYYKHFALSLKRPKDFYADTEMHNYLILPGMRCELKYTLLFQRNRQLIKAILSTTHPIYNKFSINMEYQNDQEKVLKALFFYPSLRRECGFNLGITYRNLREFKVNSFVSLPIQINEFNYAEFMVAHNLNLRSRNRTHSLKCFSRFNDFNFTMDLNTALISDSVLFNLNTDVIGRTVYVNLKSIGSIFNSLDFEVELKTPMNLVRDLRLFLLSSINDNQEFHTGMTYNSNEILMIDFSVGKEEIFLKINNTWRPILVEYKYLHTKHLEARGKICWDMNSPAVSQFGGYLVLGQNFSVGLMLPTRTMSVDASYYIDDYQEHYFGQISWYKGESVALTLSSVNVTLDNTIYLRSAAIIELPFRTFEVTDEVEANFQELATVKSKITFKWNNDEKSKISFQNHILPGQLESKLFIPALGHEIVLHIDISSLAKIPSRLEAFLEYSEDPNRRIEFVMFYNKSFTNIFHTERQFILRHPISKIDYSLCFSTTRTPEYTIGNITLQYTNYLLERREHIRSSLKIGHERFEVAGELETSKNYLSASGVSKSGPTFQGFQIDMQINKQEPLNIEGIYNFKSIGSSLSLSTSSGKNKMYNFYAGFPSKREITAKLMHELYGTEITDALVTLKLNSSQILWLKLNWKYQLLPRFQSAILEEYNDIKYIIDATGQQLIDVIDDDFGKSLISDVRNLQKNLTDYSKQEVEYFKEDYGRFASTIEIGYHTNGFFCKDVEKIIKLLFPDVDILAVILNNPLSDLVQAVYDSLASTLSDIFLSLHNIFSKVQEQVELSFREVKDIKYLKTRAKEILKHGINDARRSLKEMDVLIDRLLNNTDEFFEELKQKCEEFFEPYLKLLDDFVIYVEQRLAILQMLVLDMLETIQHYILSLRESREILKVYMLYANWLEEFHISDILEPVADIIEVILETLVTDFKKVMDDYKSYVDGISEAIFGNYQEINKLPPVTEFREMINNIYQRTLWIWNYHNLTEIIRNSFRKFISDFDDYLASLLELDNSNDFENILGQSDYVIRPDLGVIEITQPLPVEWEAFDEMPYFEQYPLYQKIKRRTESLIQIQRHHFVDLVSTIGNYIGESPGTLLSPSTNNVAVLVGKSHYITFDKKYYNFAGECSYLLASDFVSKTFSVIVNYEMSNATITKRSINVISSGNNLEVFPDFTLKLNDKKVAVPLIAGSLTAIREHNDIIIKNGKGLKVVCNMYFDYCTVELSGWLFGKTGGLLGTLDNEKVTDMSLPGGYRASSVLEFVQSWQVGTTKCKNINHANDTAKVNISPLSTTLFETLCQVFFVNVNSPLGHCFNSIDPKPFYEMCVNNMKDSTNPTLCSSIAAYRTQCQGATIAVDMPEMCVHCKHGLSLSEDIFDGSNPKSLDIVFIKQSACFDFDYDFSNLPELLDEALMEKGFNDNQFIVVGFGKEFAKPYVCSSGQETWTSAKNTTIDVKMNTSSTLQQQVSGIDAIRFASNLDFRPGVSKIFILIQCYDESDVENLNNLHNMFGEKDITLHKLKMNLLHESNEELLELDNKGHILYAKYGYNVQNLHNTSINTIFTEKNPNEITDIYSLLALSSNGTVLNVGYSTDYQNENIFKTWSKVISQTAKKSPCQKCKCVVNPDGTGKTECTRCMSPTVKQLLNEYESNIMEFHVDQADEDYT